MTRVYRVLRAAYQARWHKWRAGKQRTVHTSGYTGKQGAQLTLADRGATAEDQHNGTCHLTAHHRGCAELKLSLADAARARAALKLMSCGAWWFGLVKSWLRRLSETGAAGQPLTGPRKPHAINAAAYCPVRIICDSC